MGVMKQYSEVCPEGNCLGIIPLRANNAFNLPQGAYVFLDLYCDNPDCECKGGMIEIYKTSLKSVYDNSNKIVINKLPLATLRASWEDIQSEWNFEIDSSHKSYNTAKALLEFFEEVYKQKFAQTLRQHYLHFKEIINKNITTTCKDEVNLSTGSGMKVGRNDPCPCGSGKKYKKCCRNKKT